MNLKLAFIIGMKYRFRMILGIGIDVVLMEEFETSVNEQPGRYVERFFTPYDIGEARRRADQNQVLAARLAAKEAFMKAMGTGWTDEVDWLHIETRTDESGKPSLILSGTTELIAKTRGVSKIHISMSHTSAIATAVVVLEDISARPPTVRADG